MVKLAVTIRIGSGTSFENYSATALQIGTGGLVKM